MRVGVMTGGGDCPGLNAVLRAFVKVGIERYGFEILGIEDAFAGLVDLDYRSPNGNRWLGVRDVRDIEARGGTILGTSNRCDPFRFVRASECGDELEADVSARVIENVARLRLDAIVVIGGDGSMRIAERFRQLGLSIVGVPKTIDNDLLATDQTFGFDSAVHVAMEAIDRIRDTAESHDRVMLVEVMGRDAGWIALHAGIAGAADAIVIPEIPYRIETLVEMIARRKREGLAHSVVVVSEGARPVGGTASETAALPGAMARKVGAAQRIADALSARTRADVRVTVLGHVQRGGSPSPFDRILGTRCGHAAAELVASRDYGKMVALRGNRLVTAPIAEAASGQRLVAADDPLLATARAMGIVLGD
jgi:6-phosphofructokinase 1